MYSPDPVQIDINRLGCSFSLSIGVGPGSSSLVRGLVPACRYGRVRVQSEMNRACRFGASKRGSPTTRQRFALALSVQPN